jgi:hypothetical protein
MRRLVMLLALAFIALAGCQLPGCGSDRWGEISAGEYVPVRGAGGSDAASAIETVRVDRENQTAWFALTDGSQIIVPFTPRPRADWPAGCPTNVHSTRMEVVELESGALTIATTTFEDPILVRNCPLEPEEIVLRSDGEIGGGGNACSGTFECIAFEFASVATSLPHSMKGYELYSWYVEEEDDWIYTLVTGTNRLKSYAELAESESVITEDNWVKITVRGMSALKSVLNLLPEGEALLWLDAGRLEGAPAMDMAFPHRQAVNEIARYCESRGIDLDVVD